MSEFLNVLLIVFWGIIMFSIIVFIHEGGHFLAARAFGVRVKEFMLGLPGPSIGFTWRGTRYGVTAILLGGYANIAGMEGGKENPHLSQAAAYIAERGRVSLEEVQAAEETLGFDLESALDVLDAWDTVKRSKCKGGHYLYELQARDGRALGEPLALADPSAFIDEERSHTYRSLGWFKRVLILVAGAAFNMLFAVAVFTIALMAMGSQQATTTFASVAEDSPAAVAGMVAGDTVVSLAGAPVATWEDFMAGMSAYAPGDMVEVGFTHEGVQKQATVVLADNEGKALLGVKSQVEIVPVSFIDAASTAVSFIGVVAVAIVGLFNPATFGDVVSQSSSVVGISVEAKAAADAGFLNFIVLAAALSISIGLMNLLPIPPLDGGKILVETIERISRRRIPVKAINAISFAAMGLLLLLFFVVTGQDINRYILGG
ncbi:MAG: M50 family metallopeptidase [Coriobacteriales bacterium]|jgi:regulator of sigma E protease|nr:M50 family metallopeptidase [Coriobacteriales bacterium]